ncbi:MAG TPA: hypothetical protein VJS47_04660 [Rhizomicrobium sp.]|nr:hypothetical protein [Rhizomicrobium sp.]
MQRIGSVIFLSLLLTACNIPPPTRSVFIVGRTTGAAGNAIVDVSRNSGELAITIAGKEFKGQWVYVQKGGAMGSETANATSGTRSVYASGTYVDLPMEGGGTLMAASADGSSLRCTFDYNQFSATGIGQCRDNKNEIYDLQIH